MTSMRRCRRSPPPKRPGATPFAELPRVLDGHQDVASALAFRSPSFWWIELCVHYLCRKRADVLEVIRARLVGGHEQGEDVALAVLHEEAGRIHLHASLAGGAEGISTEICRRRQPRADVRLEERHD